MLSNCGAKQDEIPQQLYPATAHVRDPSLCLGFDGLQFGFEKTSNYSMPSTRI